MYLCSRSRCRINIETMETSGIPFPGRDKSLLDTWGKHQKCLSSRMQHPFKMYFCTDFHKHAKRPFKCARPYKHNNKPLELTEAERGISNPSTRASPLGHPFVPFFPPLLAPPPPTPGSKFSREMLASNARANLIRKNAFHPVETRIIRSNFVNVRNVLFFYSHYPYPGWCINVPKIPRCAKWKSGNVDRRRDVLYSKQPTVDPGQLVPSG